MLSRIARQGTAVYFQLEKQLGKLELNNLSSMRVSNRITPPLRKPRGVSCGCVTRRKQTLTTTCGTQAMLSNRTVQSTVNAVGHHATPKVLNNSKKCRNSPTWQIRLGARDRRGRELGGWNGGEVKRGHMGCSATASSSSSSSSDSDIAQPQSPPSVGESGTV